MITGQAAINTEKSRNNCPQKTPQLTIICTRPPPSYPEMGEKRRLPSSDRLDENQKWTDCFWATRHKTKRFSNAPPQMVTTYRFAVPIGKEVKGTERRKSTWNSPLNWKFQKNRLSMSEYASLWSHEHLMLQIMWYKWMYGWLFFLSVFVQYCIVCNCSYPFWHLT